jgi:predicted NBD/HSP70 family sugar kinase
MHFTKNLTNTEMATLSALWHAEGLSRRALGDELALSRPTVERALQRLIESSLITEAPSESPTRGRPAKRFTVRSDAWATLGMDLELPEINLVLSDAKGDAIQQKTLEIRQDLAEPRQVLDRLVDIIQHWLHETGTPVDRIAGLGIGVPGFLTPKGVSFVGRNLPRWEQVPVKEHLEERLSFPVFLQHDVHLMAQAEIAERGWTDGLALFVSVRPGLDDDLRIGAAICMSGRVFSGGHGNGGALYRAVVEPGPLARLDETERVQRIAERLAESLTHAIPLIDPNRIVIHAECLGDAEPALIDRCRTAIEAAMHGEYVGGADITAAAIRGASGAHQAAVAVTRHLLRGSDASSGLDGAA